VRFPSGGALSLGQCDHDNCGDPAFGGGRECVPYCAPVDRDAGVTPAPDVADTSPLRDATDASAGPDVVEASTPPDAGVDGLVEPPPPICPAPLHDSTPTCTFCEDSYCPHDATGCAFGNCITQPACSDYPNASDQALCTSVLTCIRTTNCIANGVTFC